MTLEYTVNQRLGLSELACRAQINTTKNSTNNFEIKI